MSDIEKLIEAMEKAGVEIKDSGAINSATDYFKVIAERKKDKWNSQTVWGDVHMQHGIHMDIELLEKEIASYEEVTAMNNEEKEFFYGLEYALDLIKKQLKEYPWY